MTTIDVVVSVGAAATGALVAWALAVIKNASGNAVNVADIRRDLTSQQTEIAREQDRTDDAIRERVSRLEVLIGVTRDGSHTGNGVLARLYAVERRRPD